MDDLESQAAVLRLALASATTARELTYVDTQLRVSDDVTLTSEEIDAMVLKQALTLSISEQVKFGLTDFSHLFKVAHYELPKRATQLVNVKAHPEATNRATRRKRAKQLRGALRARSKAEVSG